MELKAATSRNILNCGAQVIAVVLLFRTHYPFGPAEGEEFGLPVTGCGIPGPEQTTLNAAGSGTTQRSPGLPNCRAKAVGTSAYSDLERGRCWRRPMLILWTAVSTSLLLT